MSWRLSGKAEEENPFWAERRANHRVREESQMPGLEVGGSCEGRPGRQLTGLFQEVGTETYTALQAIQKYLGLLFYC